MRKILIISYFFPPSILTASNRVEGWAKHLAKFGYYPIVITRNWDIQGSQEKQRLQTSGKKIEVNYHDDFEVHYLPYRSSFRDICLNRNWRFLSRVLTFFELILRNFTVQIIPYRNLYFYAKKIIKKNTDITGVLISANPFEQFLFGFKLKKLFPELKWIAEYRDEWTTRKEYDSTRGKNSLVKFLERRSETKWLKEADLVFTTCSYFSNRISQLLNQNVEVIPHGMVDALLATDDREIDKQKFKIVYGGTLYSNQPVESFLRAWQSFARDKEDTELLFLGANVDSSVNIRLQPYVCENVKVTERIKRVESDKMHQEAAILLLLPYDNMKGWPSSKLYHYLTYKRPILLFPNDHDIMEEVLMDTKLGIIPKSEPELVSILELNYESWKKGRFNPIKGENIHKYTQAQQAKILSEYLNQLNAN
ncbi:glycosyltransferase family protein [Fulvivirga lutea]|uniref:Glycosyltransferase subfamily 4-like N-terminal domain-containing protein n=1 Tax=Fulvivirga lutea TaxID=2810512 RepID=A0A974WJS5_9BACT|nr:hypothetical protein [Fulvivirga lutea]QSE98447.1 hypothetical protein JR347_05050 [Fulvivirga lutea]